MAEKIEIPFLRPQLLPIGSYLDDFERIIDSGLITNGGPYEQELNEKAATFLSGGVRCVAVSNCTIGLMLALKALTHGHERGKKVLLPSFTFAATALAVEWCNLEAVFADIDPDRWALDLSEEQRERIKSRASEFAAFLVVNPFGAPADVGPWEDLAQEVGVPLVIDSAAGFGSYYEDGSRLGTRGTCEVFSLHATKTFAVGEGGLIATRDAELATTLNSMKNFGFDGETKSRLPGLNGKLAEMFCAMAVRTLERLDTIIERRRAIAAAYRERLEPRCFKFQKHGGLSTYPFVPVLVPKDRRRDEVLDRARARGVSLRRYYSPLHRHPQFAGLARLGPLTVTESVADEILSLPTRNDFSTAEIDLVSRVISGSPGA